MSEKVIYAICCVIWGAFAFLFIKLGYVDAQVCDIDKASLYCHVHPNGALSIIGQILFGLSFVFITGVWKFFTGEIITNNALAYAGIGFVVGLIGVLLIFAN